MRICTCSHTEAAHRGDNKPKGSIEFRHYAVRCNMCNCICFESKEKSLIQRVDKLEEQVAALIKNRPAEHPDGWLVLGYHQVCQRNSRALYDDYYLKSEVDAYLKHMGAIK